MFSPFSFLGKREDADASAYIQSVLANGGTLSEPQELAIHNFYTNLKEANIYDKLYVFYPFLGGTSGSNAIEGKSPSGSYDLTFAGTWAHSSTGSYCAPVSGNYANTNFNPSASATVATSFSFGVYTLGVSGSGNGYHGLGNSTANYILLGTVDTRTSYQYYNGVNTARTVNLTGNWNDGQYYFQNRVASSNVYAAYVESGSAGTVVKGITQTGTYTPANFTLWFNSNNGNDIRVGGEMRFGYAGQSLTDTQHQLFATYINNLQSAFNRNLW
jgi:hypothetical protein